MVSDAWRWPIWVHLMWTTGERRRSRPGGQPLSSRSGVSRAGPGADRPLVSGCNPAAAFLRREEVSKSTHAEK